MSGTYDSWKLRAPEDEPGYYEEPPQEDEEPEMTDPRKIVCQPDMFGGQWCAWRDGEEDYYYDYEARSYFPLHVIGHGKTEEEAIADLKEQEEER